MGQWFANWALHPLRGPSAAALGLLLAIAATAVRIALNPMLDGQSIFLLYFPALLVSSAWGGLTAGMVTAGIGGLAAVFLFSRLGMTGHGLVANLISLSFFWGVCALLMWGAISLKTALKRVLDHERELLTRHERETMVAGEMRHRIKNLLAVVQAMIWESARGAQDAKDLCARLELRLSALSAAQDVSLQPSGRAWLSEVVGAALYGFGESRLRLSLADAPLEAMTARALVLGLYELATNASKYGALSSPAGHVSLQSALSDGHLTLEWKEHDGPPVSPPARRGFGSRLIRSVPAHPDEKVELQYEPDGVRCVFVLRALPA